MSSGVACVTASARYVRHGVWMSTRSVAESRGSRGLVSDVARKSRTCCEEMSSRDHLDMLRRSCELDKLVTSRVILYIFPKTRRDRRHQSDWNVYITSWATTRSDGHRIIAVFLRIHTKHRRRPYLYGIITLGCDADITNSWWQAVRLCCLPSLVHYCRLQMTHDRNS